MVEMAHVLPFATKEEVINTVEWAFGYPYHDTLHIDTRINRMFLWVDIHRMYDAGLICLLLKSDEIEEIGKLFMENKACKNLSQRKHIPLTLDYKMPQSGWTYTVASMSREDLPWEFIHRHALGYDAEHKLRPTSEFGSHLAPYNFEITSAANPAFVLAALKCRLFSLDGYSTNLEIDTLPKFWDVGMKKRGQDMLTLAHKMFSYTISREFKRLPTTNIPTRSSKTEQAQYKAADPNQNRYDYREWDPAISNVPKPLGGMEPGTPLPPVPDNYEDLGEMGSLSLSK
ncbi:hypothetical protein H0H87_006682 [Tephrocybe sp. NHM501043]|nr:hypothetical protein H0H87_006682 [Tephrocybe sp. NHM501043]